MGKKAHPLSPILASLFLFLQIPYHPPSPYAAMLQYNLHFFLAVLLQLKSCQSEAKENTGKSTKPSVQRCYPKIPMKFVFQHPAYNTQLTFPTEMKFNELQLYYR